MRYTHIHSRRRGLTLVEMLVACALAIFLMAVLSEAFVVGLTAFRTMRAMGDMDQQLRQASILLRRDLDGNHYEGDARLRELAPGQALTGFFQIIEGFDSATNRPGVREGGDAYSVAGQLGSVRDTDDCLGLTLRLNGNRSENYFYGRVPIDTSRSPAVISPLDGYGFYNSRWDPSALTYSGQWAEVIWFLRPDSMGLTTEAPEGLVDGAGNPLQRMPLYQLFRRQRLLVPDNFAQGTTASTGTTTGAPTADFNHHDGNADVAAYQATGGASPTWRFTGPGDIQFPMGLKYTPGAGGGYQWDWGRRFRPITNPLIPAAGAVPQMVGFPRVGNTIGELPNDPSGDRTGADLLLNNVISFDVKVWDQSALGGLGAFVDLGFGTPPASTTGAWTPTTRTPANPRPLGNTPLDLAYTSGSLPVPTYHTSQRVFSNAWVYDTWTRRMGGGDVLHPNGWNFKSVDFATGAWRHQEPYPTAIQAIQIKIRLWDRKTNQTREVTIIQDM